MLRAPHLGRHQALKIPHHASWASMHHELLECAPTSRAWVVTPLHKGSNHLPNLAPDDGLELHTRFEERVMVTAEPRASRRPPEWTLDALRADVMTPATGDPLVDRGVILGPATSTGPLDATWAVEFDQAGAVTARYRGDAAFDGVRTGVRLRRSVPQGRGRKSLESLGRCAAARKGLE